MDVNTSLQLLILNSKPELPADYTDLINRFKNLYHDKVLHKILKVSTPPPDFDIIHRFQGKTMVTIAGFTLFTLEVLSWKMSTPSDMHYRQRIKLSKD
jgi:hypothetical protein